MTIGYDSNATRCRNDFVIVACLAGKVRLDKTCVLMSELGFKVRDTYQACHNFDDFYSNGNKYDGPRLVSLEWVPTSDFPKIDVKKKYEIPNFQSVAYDTYKILIPDRYRSNGRDDPIIHECVHFLQHNTTAEDNSYIRYSGSNYREYISQRVELEAHLVQILYIFKHCDAYRNSVLSHRVQQNIRNQFSHFQSAQSQHFGIQIIVASKNGGLI